MVDKKILDMLEKLPKEYLYSITDEIVEQWEKYQYDCYRQNIADELAKAIPFLTNDCYNRRYTCARFDTMENAREGECLDFFIPQSTSLLDCFVDIYEFLERTGLNIVAKTETDDPNDENWAMYLMLSDNTFIQILPH